MGRAVLAVMSLVSTLAFAQVPQQIGYQGRLLKADGKPEVGSINIGFSIFATATGGSPLWSEMQALALVDGYYATFIGQNVPLVPAVFSDGGERFLEVTIGGTPLSPRQKLASVPYAYRARELSGGSVNASSISVNDKTVIGAAGQVEPSALDLLSQPGTINELDNPVDWSRLKNVPADFADGTDEGGSSGTSIPAGSIIAFGGTAAPAGWLLCNGAAVSRSAYADLFAAVGTAYGAGDNFTTFNLPDLRQRFPIGKGGAFVEGQRGGNLDHTHGMAHNHAMPHTHGMAHTHGMDHTHPMPHTHPVNPPATTTSNGDSFNNSCQSGGINCGVHTHTVNIPEFNSLSPSVPDTEGASALATGASSTPSTLGVSTPDTGASKPGVTDTANPPYLVLNFIIKT